MKSLILVGGGGHCRSCIDVVSSSQDYNIKGIVEKDSNCAPKDTLGFNVIGYDEDLPCLIKKFQNVLITIGQIKNSRTRSDMFIFLKKIGANFPIISSPHSYISKTSEVNEGCIIMHGAILNSQSQVKENCIINSNALIEHDVVIEKNSHVSTGASINGEAYIESGVFIGSGATIIEGVKIGANSIIGAGTTVLKDLPSNSVFTGIK